MGAHVSLIRVHDVLTTLKLEGWATEEERTFAITDLGLAVLGPTMEPLTSGGSVIRLWEGVLTKKQSSLLRALASAFPRGQTKKQIANFSGYAESSSSKFGAPLIHLENCGLVISGDRVFKLNPNIMAMPFEGY